MPSPKTATPQALATTYENLPRNIKDSFCPPATTIPSVRLNWIKRFLDQSDKNLESSANYQRMKQAVDALYNGSTENSPTGRISPTEFNRTKRQGQKIVATLSDISPSWDYSSHNRSLDVASGMLSKLFEAVWQHPSTQSRESLIELFQYAITGEGYLSPIWEDDIYSQINGDLGLKFKPYPLDAIYHTQLPQDKNLQKCYAVGICNQLPITQAAMLYPEHIEYLHPSAKPVGFFKRLGNRVKEAFTSPALNAGEDDRKKFYGTGGGSYDTQMNTITEDKAIEVYDIYIQDCSINQGSSRLSMGRPGTNEYYEVPYLGEPISTPANHPTGQPITRPATAKECLIYPYRRRIICTRDHIIYDGPSPWLHGQVPLVRFAPDDWPWDEVGNALVLESHSLNQTIESLFRGVHDMVNLRLDPPQKLPTSLSKATTDQLNLRMPGRHIRVDSFDSTKVETLHPPAMLQIEPQILGFIQEAERESDYIMGEADLKSLAQANQIPSAESVDRFLQNVSPLATMISRNIEGGLLKVGNLTKFLLLQYATSEMRMKIFGRDGLLKEDFDWQPGTMIPANSPKAFATTPGESLRKYASQFYFNIIPGSAYRLTDQTRQLMIFQLWRDQRFPVGPWTIAKAFNIDIGPPPKEARTELEQWLYFQEVTAKFQMKIQHDAQLVMAQAQLQAQQMAMAQQAQLAMTGMGAMAGMEGMGGPGMPPAATEPQPAPQPSRPEGRPPSGSASPKLASRDGGQRQTITES